MILSKISKKLAVSVIEGIVQSSIDPERVPINTIKKVISVAIGYSTNKVVLAVIESNIDPEKVKDKITVKTGTVVLGGMAAIASKEYTDKKIDEWYADWVKKAKKAKDQLPKDSPIAIEES